MMDHSETRAIRKKRFSNKVRSGCITCRIRRIKCDEAKPSCHRCTSTGRKCDGYAVPTLGKRQTYPYQDLTSSSCGTSEERQALYLYRTTIAELLVSAFDVQFWTCDLLQTAAAFKVVHHGLVALAAAYQANILKYDQCNSQRLFVLEQYNKAMSSLQPCLVHGNLNTTAKKVVVLISNLVFNCICALQGLRTETCLHLKSGLALLHEWKLEAEDTNRTAMTPTSIDLLVSVYTRLDTQARAFITANDMKPLEAWPSHIVSIACWQGGSADTTTKAFSQLDRLYNLLRQTRMAHQPSPNDAELSASAMDEHKSQLLRWDEEFGWLLSHSGATNLQSVRMLAIHRYLVGAYLDVLRPEPETYTGACPLRPACREIVRLARQTIQALGVGAGKAIFNPGGNLVEALYFVARHCPEDDVQRQAIDLLEGHCITEGLWKSDAAAMAARGAR